MKKLTFLFLFICPILLFSQEELREMLDRNNRESIPYITVTELKMLQHNNPNVLVLDAREEEEYQVSHLKNAIWVGYSSFQLEKVSSKIEGKNQPIIVYCSLGVRSEDIAEKLEKAGYTNVQNLFGGIFEWKNESYSIFKNQKETDSIHAFSKKWSKWLKNGIKVY